MRTAYLILIAIAAVGFFIKDIRGLLLKGSKPEEYVEPIALVRVGDTVYQCSYLSLNFCGLYAKCGKDTFVCLNSKSYDIEYLVNLEPKED